MNRILSCTPRRPSSRRPVTRTCLALVAMLLPVHTAWAQIDWDAAPLVKHSAYQAVDASGGSAYSGPAPFRMVGVVLNDNELWLDPTANFIATDWPATSFQLGGQAEIFVQTIEPPEIDFGGTAAWMGQNYGNHPMKMDTFYSYTDAEWYAELDRLGWWRPGSTLDAGQLVRAGDLIEIRARVEGLHFAGKKNINEQHDNDPANDFEIVILQKGYGLPAATPLHLSDLKYTDNAYIFDTTRDTGGERHQSTLVEMRRVRLQDTGGWAPYATLTLVDENGLTLPVRLGNNTLFADPADAPWGWFNVTGILNQSQSGTFGQPGFNAGYYLMALQPASFTHLPGDANRDWAVDNTDLGLAFGNFTGPNPPGGPAHGKTWEQGDFNADGAVDNTDLGLAFGSFTGPVLPPQPTGTSIVPTGEPLSLDPILVDAQPTAGNAALLYHLGTGEVWLDHTNAPGGIITNFVLKNNASGLIAGVAAFPFAGSFKTDLPFEISQTDPLAAGWPAAHNPWLLGAIFPVGMDQGQLNAFLDQATYVGTLGSGVHNFDLVVVPEPAGLLLLLAALPAIGLWMRRHRVA